MVGWLTATDGPVADTADASPLQLVHAGGDVYATRGLGAADQPPALDDVTRLAAAAVAAVVYVVSDADLRNDAANVNLFSQLGAPVVVVSADGPALPALAVVQATVTPLLLDVPDAWVCDADGLHAALKTLSPSDRRPAWVREQKLLTFLDNRNVTPTRRDTTSAWTHVCRWVGSLLTRPA